MNFVFGHNTAVLSVSLNTQLIWLTHTVILDSAARHGQSATKTSANFQQRNLYFAGSFTYPAEAATSYSIKYSATRMVALYFFIIYFSPPSDRRGRFHISCLMLTSPLQFRRCLSDLSFDETRRNISEHTQVQSFTLAASHDHKCQHPCHYSRRQNWLK